MSTACIPMNFRNPFFPPIDTGVSETAAILKKTVEEILGDCSRSVTLDDQSMIRALSKTWEECSVDNWDGYGAKAISLDSYRNARLFVMTLPTTVPLPEVSVDPDGEVSFEWFREPRMVFSLSIGAHNEINYAGLFGHNKVNGKEHFYDEIPKAIFDNLDRLLSR